MEILELVFTSFVTGIISVVAAVVILWLQRRGDRKRIIYALYNEIDNNLDLAQELLPISETFDCPRDNSQHTYFDLKHFYNSSYEDFRRSGYSKFSRKIKQLLEEVYRLISAHNIQTDCIIHGGFPPRTGGYSVRIKIMIEKLQFLKKELMCGK